MHSPQVSSRDWPRKLSTQRSNCSTPPVMPPLPCTEPTLSHYRPCRSTSWTLSGVLLGVLSTLLALLVATVALYTDRVPQLLRQGAGVLAPPLRALRIAHSGHLGDYVVWLLLGVTLLTIGIAAS
ncbi:MAG: hypothetical protein ACRDQY_13125 [Pseudonocardiaceae bacterium]